MGSELIAAIIAAAAAAAQQAASRAQQAAAKRNAANSAQAAKQGSAAGQTSPSVAGDALSAMGNQLGNQQSPATQQLTKLLAGKQQLPQGQSLGQAISSMQPLPSSSGDSALPATGAGTVNQPSSMGSFQSAMGGQSPDIQKLLQGMQGNQGFDMSALMGQTGGF